MHSLTIVFGPQATTWVLLFKSAEAAKAAHAALADGSPTDDFGQTASIQIGSIHGIMLEDLSLSKQVHIETSLHQGRIMAEAQQAANVDPALKQAAHQLRQSAQLRGMRNGPPILSPMG